MFWRSKDEMKALFQAFDAKRDAPSPPPPPEDGLISVPMSQKAYEWYTSQSNRGQLRNSWSSNNYTSALAQDMFGQQPDNSPTVPPPRTTRPVRTPSRSYPLTLGAEVQTLNEAVSRIDGSISSIIRLLENTASRSSYASLQDISAAQRNRIEELEELVGGMEMRLQEMEQDLYGG